MFELPKHKLVRKTLRVHNPSERVLVIWLEPWAERHELTPQQSLEIVFFGPTTGSPEISPRADEISIYGWEGSAAIAIKNGQLAARQPSLDEIVRQEFEIAGGQVERTEMPLPANEIALTQRMLDADHKLNTESQELVCELAGHVTCDLAPTVKKSSVATEMLWQIASRLVGTKGLVLAAPDPRIKENAIWNDAPGPLIELIRTNVKSVLPEWSRRHSARERTPRSMPRRAETESDPTIS